jgi:hypothetical protein
MRLILYVCFSTISTLLWAQESWTPYPILSGINVYFPELPTVNRIDSVDTDVISYSTKEELFLATVTDIRFDRELDSVYYMQILNKYIRDMAQGNILLNNVSDKYKQLLCKYFKIKSLEDIQNPLITENICFIYKGKVVCLCYWDISKSPDNALRAKAFFEKATIEPVASLSEQSAITHTEDRVNALPVTKHIWLERLPLIALLMALIVIFYRISKKSKGQ